MRSANSPALGSWTSAPRGSRSSGLGGGARAGFGNLMTRDFEPLEVICPYGQMMALSLVKAVAYPRLEEKRTWYCS
jgi:hypothetical protein